MTRVRVCGSGSLLFVPVIQKVHNTGSLVFFSGYKGFIRGVGWFMGR